MHFVECNTIQHLGDIPNLFKAKVENSGVEFGKSHHVTGPIMGSKNVFVFVSTK